ncbi:hypothetical protein [Actinoplanes sp. NPDC051411]|uniref:hypothetical protein n=1 Tax=Actinoplanes sp. NPDC051411 TaxID=3155522 RepID=UPI00342C1E7D
MSSKLFKTVFAGVVAAGALLLSGSAAQAATNHRPCDGPGFGDRGFFGDHFGNRFGDRFGDRFGFRDDSFGFFGDDFGFRRHDRQDRPTVIVVNVVNKNKTKTRTHHKPAVTPPPAVTGNSAGAGYPTPGAAGNGSGYHKR